MNLFRLLFLFVFSTLMPLAQAEQADPQSKPLPPQSWDEWNRSRKEIPCQQLLGDLDAMEQSIHNDRALVETLSVELSRLAGQVKQHEEHVSAAQKAYFSCVKEHGSDVCVSIDTQQSAFESGDDSLKQQHSRLEAQLQQVNDKLDDVTANYNQRVDTYNQRCADE